MTRGTYDRFILSGKLVLYAMLPSVITYLVPRRWRMWG